MVTLIRSGRRRRACAASPWAFSSARQAEASLRASSRTVPGCVAQAASPQAIVPLPGDRRGCSYRQRRSSHRAGYYHARASAASTSSQSTGYQSALTETELTEDLTGGTMASNGKFQGREVVIVEAVRTPVGRGHEEKGYYKDIHPSNLLAKTYARADRPRRHRAVRGRGRRRRLRAAVRRAGDQHRPQRLARGRAADRDPGDHRRPPVRLGPAGDQLRRRAGRLRRPRRRRSAAASSTWATSPSPTRSRCRRSTASPSRPQLMERYNLVPQGISAEMIADKWEIPRSELDEIGAALAPARREGDRGGPLRARDDPVPGQRRHLHDRPGHPPRHQPRGARRS